MSKTVRVWYQTIDDPSLYVLERRMHSKELHKFGGNSHSAYVHREDIPGVELSQIKDFFVLHDFDGSMSYLKNGKPISCGTITQTIRQMKLPAVQKMLRIVLRNHCEMHHLVPQADEIGETWVRIGLHYEAKGTEWVSSNQNMFRINMLEGFLFDESPNQVRRIAFAWSESRSGLTMPDVMFNWNYMINRFTLVLPRQKFTSMSRSNLERMLTSEIKLLRSPNNYKAKDVLCQAWDIYKLAECLCQTGMVKLIL